ncbi:hypothetical protein [Xanthomonas phage RTH11]|nr:hypothetical protein [Xanthomonas phage RTH11]
MTRKKFKDLEKMVDHILADPRMQNEAVMINGAPINTDYLKECLTAFRRIEMRLILGESVSPLERLAVELIMQTFGVEFQPK